MPVPVNNVGQSTMNRESRRNEPFANALTTWAIQLIITNELPSYNPRKGLFAFSLSTKSTAMVAITTRGATNAEVVSNMAFKSKGDVNPLPRNDFVCDTADYHLWFVREKQDASAEGRSTMSSPRADGRPLLGNKL